MTDLCKGTLAAAVMPGGRIDAAHPAVVTYAIGRGLDPASLLDSAPVNPAKPRASKPAKQSSAVIPPLADPSQVTDVLDLTLRQVTDEHGSKQGLADWLDLRKTAAEIVRLEMANLEKAGTLIERDRVRTHVFGYFDGAQKRLLSDCVPTIVRRSFAIAKSGGAIEEAEKSARETLSSILRPARDQAVRTLRRKHKKGSDDE